MRASTYHSSAYRGRPSPANRLVSLALAFTLLVALLLALLRLGVGLRRDDPSGGSLTAFDVADAPRTASAERQRTPAAPAPDPERRKPIERPPAPTPPPVTFDQIPGMIVLSRRDYASADIDRMPRRSPSAGSVLADAAGTTTAGVPGAAPDGSTLYPAEWYREPTRAETGPFMPPGRAGWGLIACRTAARYRVEDCRLLDESPGSGIGQGLRRAAWQFLVRPPLQNGKPIIGAWVRIRFDLVMRSQ